MVNQVCSKLNSLWCASINKCQTQLVDHFDNMGINATATFKDFYFTIFADKCRSSTDDMNVFRNKGQRFGASIVAGNGKDFLCFEQVRWLAKGYMWQKWKAK